jgi:hypothetical protein
MKKSTTTVSIIPSVLAGLLTLALVGVATPALAGPSQAQTTHDSVVVTAIDRANRTATLQNVQGDTHIVKVPADVVAFDTLKIGDHVDIDYYQSVALSLLPAGTTPSVSESSSGTRMGGGVGMGTRQMTMSAEILAIDLKTSKVTLKGPRGLIKTVSVSDPELQRRLPALRPGQVVQVTYTEEIAASLRPTSNASSRWQP